MRTAPRLTCRRIFSPPTETLPTVPRFEIFRISLLVYKWIGAIREVFQGDPDSASINTSFAERQNLAMRMSRRRFTGLTNAFNKKVENHCHALALYFIFYNFWRVHQALGRRRPERRKGRLRRLWFADPTRKRLLKFQTETLPAVR